MLDVACDLVHGLADANDSGQMHDSINTSESTVSKIDIADVSDEQLDLGGKLGRQVTMNLRLETIEYDDRLASFDEPRDET